MPTYLELEREPEWGAQFTPANMTNILVVPLRRFYAMGPTLIGAPGDNNHLRGRHRSRNWDLLSRYCTDRDYATRDPRDVAGNPDWYRAIDVGITGQTLYRACRRLDTLVRSGKDGGKVAEWFGTFDGRTVVGWFEGHQSTSGISHLRHLHVGVWTKWANDAALMKLLYETITGTGGAAMAQMLIRNTDDAKLYLCDGMFRREVTEAMLPGIGNGQTHQSGFLGLLGNGGQVFPTAGNMDVWGALYPPDPGEVASGAVTIDEIRAVVDEELDEQSRAGADTD